MAYWRRRPGKGLIHHSDRGSQYAGSKYQKLLEQYGMTCSMSRKGDCWDNAVLESFFHSLKTEWIVGIIYKTRAEARSDVIKYIEMFYNIISIHSWVIKAQMVLKGNLPWLKLLNWVSVFTGPHHPYRKPFRHLKISPARIFLPYFPLYTPDVLFGLIA